jgi:hypothetical protein
MGDIGLVVSFAVQISPLVLAATGIREREVVSVTENDVLAVWTGWIHNLSVIFVSNRPFTRDES